MPTSSPPGRATTAGPAARLRGGRRRRSLPVASSSRSAKADPAVAPFWRELRPLIICRERRSHAAAGQDRVQGGDVRGKLLLRIADLDT